MSTRFVWMPPKGRSIGAVLAILALLLVLPASVPAISAQESDGEESPEVDPRFDEPFGAPQYLIHLTGTHTYSGFVEKDSYLLYHTAPDGEGVFITADGSGGTFTNTGELIGGPFDTPREVCAAAGGLPVSTFNAWNSNYYFSCDAMAASSGNGGGLSPLWIAAGGAAAAALGAAGLALARGRGKPAPATAPEPAEPVRGQPMTKLGLIVPAGVSGLPPVEGVEAELPESELPAPPPPPETGLPPDVDPCADMARLFNEASELARAIRDERARIQSEFEARQPELDQLNGIHRKLCTLDSQIDDRVILAQSVNAMTFWTYATSLGTVFRQVSILLGLAAWGGGKLLDDLETRYGTRVMTDPVASELAAELRQSYRSLGDAYVAKAKAFNKRQEQLEDDLRKVEDAYARTYDQYQTSRYLCAHDPNRSLEHEAWRPEAPSEKQTLAQPWEVRTERRLGSRAKERYP